mgnify:CR=1 FL=1
MVEPFLIAAAEGAEYAKPAYFADGAVWVALAMLAVIALMIWKRAPAAIGKSLDDKIAMIRARHHHRRSKAIIPRNPAQCLFKQGFGAEQGQKRLGRSLAADRPQPCAAATAQDHWLNCSHLDTPRSTFPVPTYTPKTNK